MATDIATLALKADSTEIVNAANDLDNLGDAAGRSGQATDNFSNTVKRGSKANSGFSASTKKASGIVDGMGRNAGMAGIQIQQFVGQVQGGQSAMVALSQQSADLGFVLGAPLAGVAVSLGAVLAGVLLPSIMDSENAAEQLAETMGRLDGVLASSETGVLSLSKEIQALAGASEIAAQARLASAMLDAKDAMDQARESVRGASDDLLSGFFSTATYDQLIAPFEVAGDASASLSRTLELTKDEAEELQGAFKAFGGGGESGRDVVALSERFDKLFLSIENPSEKVREFQAKLSLLAQDSKKAESSIEFLEGALGDLGGTIDVSVTSPAEKLLQTLKGQEATYGQTAAQAQLYRLALAEGVTPAILEEAEALQKSLDLKIANAKADAAAANKAKRDAANAKAEQNRINESADRIRFQMLSEEQQLQESYDRRRDIINNSTELSAMEKAEIIARLDKEEGEIRQASIYSNTEAILSSTAAQMSQLSALFEEGSTASKAFYLVSQGIAAATAVVHGLQAAMAIRVAYSELAVATGNPALQTMGEVHANTLIATGVATAGMIAGQTIASFDGGGSTGSGPRIGGLDGKGGFMAMLHPQETVVDHTRGQSMGGVNVQVINYGGDNVQTSQDGNNLKIIIGQVKQSISNDISRGVGPVTKSLQGTFGLTRQGNR